VPLTDHVAVVSLTRDISRRTLLQVVAAVQKQVVRDFAPIWGLPATVDAFDDLSSVPSDYHPVVIFGDAEELLGQLEVAIGGERVERLVGEFRREEVAGLHLNAFTRQPFALVAATETWAITVSHEVLEMIADPYGNHLVAASHPQDQRRRVKYLLEVCDPCLSTWYPVNGVPVADFYTPRYFDPVRVESLRYSFTGALERPLHILRGGYLTWIDPDDSGIYQLTDEDSEPVLLADIAELARSSTPLRALVDGDPRTPRIRADRLRAADSALAGDGAAVAVVDAARGNAVRTAQAVASVASGLG
jgi:hypothetical protein